MPYTTSWEIGSHSAAIQSWCFCPVLIDGPRVDLGLQYCYTVTLLYHTVLQAGRLVVTTKPTYPDASA
jgi:hypothetical protein